MSYKNNLIYNSLELPAYWWATARAKARLSKDWQVEKHFFGLHRSQYFLVVSHPDVKASKWAIYLHGGAWTFGTPEQFLPAAYPFLAAGYQVVMPSYRRLPKHNFTHIWEDLTTMLQLIKENSLSSDRDLKRAGEQPFHPFTSGPTVIAGMSGGGHLAASLAWNEQLWEDLNWATPETAILCGAVLDLERMPDSFGLRMLAGSRSGELFQRASPINHLRRNHAPPKQHLLVHGTADKMVAVDQTLCTREVLKNKPTQLETIIIPNGTHLDACRWMYREDEVLAAIRKVI